MRSPRQSKRSTMNKRTAVARESSRRSGSPFLLKILGREMLRCEWGGSGERIGSLSTRRSDASSQMLRVCTKTFPMSLTPEIKSGVYALAPPAACSFHRCRAPRDTRSGRFLSWTF